MSFTPGTRLGPYDVVGSIGAGGMGEVYRARDPRLQRDVAIKVLPAAVASDADRLARFTREAQLLASLNHQHIAHVYGVEQDGSTRALVMELVEGPTLAERMTGGAIAVEDALPIARQIADALDAAHERGIIHRDLKPANIKFTPEGSVKVLDFGLAKALDQGSGGRDQESGENANSPTLTTPAMTQAGIILGTAAYMSPEQARGKVVDKRADIWSFGVILYEMLTGKQLFAGETVSDTIAEVLKREFDWNALPAATPPGMRRVLERALQRDPRKRLRDIGDALVELDAAPGAEKTVTFQRASGVSWAMVSVATVAVASVAAAAAWFMKPTPPETPRPLVRYAIPIDEPIANASRQSVVVSPDGSMLAINTTAGILVRRRDGLDITPLKNTENAGPMAFSADGRSLAFFAAGQLKTIELAGGAVQTIYKSGLGGGTPNGLTWSTEGSLAFPSSEGFRILRPGSAAPVDLALPDAVVHGLPHFLPDGQALLHYQGRTATAESHVVMLHPLNGGEPVELVKGSAPQFVPPDTLLFTRGSTLHAVTFDLAARRVGGDPQIVANDLLAAGANFTPHFTTSRTGDLYYVRGEGDQGVEGSRLTRVRLGSQATPMLDDVRVFVDVRYSPDGRKLAVHVADQQSDIWVLDIARRVLNRVTFVDGEDETPVWSPDGTQIAFATTRAGDQERTIRIKRADGTGDERIVFKYAGHAHVSDWSPDGRFLLVDLVTPDRGIHLLDVNQPGTLKPFVQTTFTQSNGRVSPNGRFVAYMSNESSRFEIYLQSFPGGGNKIQVSTGGGMTPVWSVDGTRLYYRGPGQVMAVTVADKSELTVSTPQAVVADTYGYPLGDTHTSYDVSRDGEFVFTQVATTGARSKPIVHAVLNWSAATSPRN